LGDRMRWHHYQRFVRVVVVAWSMLFASLAQAQALPAYNGRMNMAVGGIVSAKVSKWGFAANDPRVTATGSAIGSGLTYLGVGLATGAVATVGWPALLIGAGISAVVGGGVSLAIDGLYKWLFNSDGTVTTQGGTVTVADPNGRYVPVDAQQAASCIETTATNWCACQDAGCPIANISVCLPVGGSNPTNLCRPGWDAVRATSVEDAMIRSSYSIPTTTTNGDVTNAPASTAASKIPAAELAKPLSNEMLAAAANAAWKAAAANAGGLPWSASDPITPADVAQWRAENPSTVPSVGDMTAPITNGSAVSVGPAASPGGATLPSTGPAPTPGSGTQVDLGPNPNTPAPGLETTPNAQQILSPLLTLMPDLRAFAVPAHVGSCPKPSFVALDRTFTFESHCGLVESNRSIIEAAMLLVWSIAAVFIVLRA
jgi:hypothetical protein